MTIYQKIQSGLTNSLWMTVTPQALTTNLEIRSKNVSNPCRSFIGVLPWILAVLIATGLAGTVFAQSSSDSISDEISYSNDIQPIMNNFCTTCHSGEDPRGGFVLTDYASVRKYVEEGDLLHRINDAEDPMPPAGLIPGYMRRMVKIWSETGFIEKGKKRAMPRNDSLDYGNFTPPEIKPVNINETGFDLLQNMQGHWVGSMNLMGQDFPWFAFDFRAIAPSHVHGIFEGGTIGNLFTSFFVTNYKGQRTIMARNGGILNGIYRTSYFVLDHVEERRNQSGQRETYYRLVDAYGGKDIMWMELTFTGRTIQFNSYTSRFGLNAPAKLHMKFSGERMHPRLAEQAARAVGFPKNVLDLDFASGLPAPDWGEGVPQTSASYIWEDSEMSILELGKISKDPYRIDQMPHVSNLTISVERNATIENQKLQIYLSHLPLTDRQGKLVTEYGYLRTAETNSLLMFSEVTGNTDEFTFTYLHPGEYYLTVVADLNKDGFPSPGDVTHPSKKIVVKPKSDATIEVKDIVVRN